MSRDLTDEQRAAAVRHEGVMLALGLASAALAAASLYRYAAEPRELTTVIITPPQPATPAGGVATGDRIEPAPRTGHPNADWISERPADPPASS